MRTKRVAAEKPARLLSQRQQTYTSTKGSSPTQAGGLAFMAGRGTQQHCATGLPHLGAATDAQQPVSGGKAHRGFSVAETEANC